MAICAIHASPVVEGEIVRRAGIGAVPSASPARYTARKPEPCSVSAAPNAIAAVAIEATG